MHKRITVNSNSKHLLYISASTIEGGFLPTLHSHPNLEVLLITEGEGTIITTNRKLKVKEKDIVIINPNSTHYESGEGLSFFALGVRDTEIFLKDTFTKKIIISSLSNYDYPSIKSMYQLMYDEATRNDSKSENIINASYDILFSLLERTYTILNSDSKKQNESDLVSNIKSILDNYYYTDISLDQLAHRFSQSKSNICHIFKNETGYSIIEYKILKELDEARNLLKISDMNISDIAFQVGFNNTSYFNKVFKSKYGMTPKKYKESLK